MINFFPLILFQIKDPYLKRINRYKLGFFFHYILHKSWYLINSWNINVKISFFIIHQFLSVWMTLYMYYMQMPPKGRPKFAGMATRPIPNAPWCSIQTGQFTMERHVPLDSRKEVLEFVVFRKITRQALLWKSDVREHLIWQTKTS